METFFFFFFWEKNLIETLEPMNTQEVEVTVGEQVGLKAQWDLAHPSIRRPRP